MTLLPGVARPGGQFGGLGRVVVQARTKQQQPGWRAWLLEWLSNERRVYCLGSNRFHSQPCTICDRLDCRPRRRPRRRSPPSRRADAHSVRLAAQVRKHRGVGGVAGRHQARWRRTGVEGLLGLVQRPASHVVVVDEAVVVEVAQVPSRGLATPGAYVRADDRHVVVVHHAVEVGVAGARVTQSTQSWRPPPAPRNVVIRAQAAMVALSA